MNHKNSDGKLLLAVKRGDEITIEYSKNQIMNKINSYFGYQLIKEIKIETFSAKEKSNNKKNILGNFSKNFEEKISKVENLKIRNSLSQLLKAIKND